MTRPRRPSRRPRRRPNVLSLVKEELVINTDKPETYKAPLMAAERSWRVNSVTATLVAGSKPALVTLNIFGPDGIAARSRAFPVCAGQKTKLSVRIPPGTDFHDPSSESTGTAWSILTTSEVVGVAYVSYSMGLNTPDY